jgi:hypothetical protein
MKYNIIKYVMEKPVQFVFFSMVFTVLLARVCVAADLHFSSYINANMAMQNFPFTLVL